MSGGSGDFDDAPQWYWAAADSMSEGRPDQASDRFVVATTGVMGPRPARSRPSSSVLLAGFWP
jgi:hypothetical protein